MGKLHVCKSTVVDEIQGIQHFFPAFIVSKYNTKYKVQYKEHNTVDWRTFVKNTAKLRRKMIFSYSISLKYTTQARSNKNQMFLGLKYIPA